MMRRAFYRLARLVPVASIAAAVIFPTTAVADVTSIQVLSAALVAKGAEVDVTITFTCTAGDTVAAPQGAFGGGLGASVQQAVSKTEQALGFGQGGGQTCTGSPQTGVVQVLANVPGPPFRIGPAVVNAFVTACGTAGCFSATSGLTTVRIRH